MQQYFEIQPSSAQFWLTIVGHGSIALAIAFYIDSSVLQLCGLTLVSLLALREARHLLRQETLSLKFNTGDASIELRQGGQPYFFGKYKVYATRWFAILKLIDKQKTWTLILNPDRCNSIQSYRQLRYTLQTMVNTDAA